jgi:hypothetical protein
MVRNLFHDERLRQQPDALFEAAVRQVSQQLRGADDSTAGVLATYFSKRSPTVGGEPFCVALARSTCMYQMQLARAPPADAELWVRLFAATANGLLGKDKRRGESALAHPFFATVLRRWVFGLAAIGSGGPSEHAVVLLPAGNFIAFSHLAVGLAKCGSLPNEIVHEWMACLEQYSDVPSPLVALRAQQLVVRCHGTAPEYHAEHLMELQAALQAKPSSLPLEQLRLLYLRLEAVAPDVGSAPMQARALVIAASSLFLPFTSPVRREFAERMLYPTVTHADMEPMLQTGPARLHLCQLLLRLLGSAAPPTCPFYLCLCALTANWLDDDIRGAQLFVTLPALQMPQGAYFCAAMTQHHAMPIDAFASIVLRLVRGVAIALRCGSDNNDAVASMIGDQASLAYKSIYVLRLIVKRVMGAAPSSRRSRMIDGLRAALPKNTLAALGQIVSTSFVDHEEACGPLPPALLVAEMAMVLHGDNVVSALDQLALYFSTSAELCSWCNRTLASSELCPTNGTEHTPQHGVNMRLLRTVAGECCGNDNVIAGLSKMLRRAPLATATHRTVFEVLRLSESHLGHVFAVLNTHVAHALATVTSTAARNIAGQAPRRRGRDDGAEATADLCSGIVFHTRTAALLSPRGGTEGSVTTAFQRTVNALAKLADIAVKDGTAASHHVALTVWWACGWLLRNAHRRCVQLQAVAGERNDSIAAANAMKLLATLRLTHDVSAEMRKLVGLATTRLVMDFNMQASNIAEHLLHVFHEVPATHESLAHFALPTNSDTVFWTFAADQLRRSMPFRTSFVTTLAQSAAVRFRCDDPTSALLAAHDGAGPRATLFFTFVMCAMQHNRGLRHLVVALVCQWLELGREKKHTPGVHTIFVHVLQQVTTHLIEWRSDVDDDDDIEVLDQAQVMLAKHSVLLSKMAQRVAPHNATFGTFVEQVASAAAEVSDVDVVEGSSLRSELAAREDSADDYDDFGADNGGDDDDDVRVSDRTASSSEDRLSSPSLATMAIGQQNASPSEASDTSVTVSSPQRPIINSEAAAPLNDPRPVVFGDEDEDVVEEPASTPADGLAGAQKQHADIARPQRVARSEQASSVPQAPRRDEIFGDDGDGFVDEMDVWELLRRQSTRSLMMDLRDLAAASSDDLVPEKWVMVPQEEAPVFSAPALPVAMAAPPAVSVTSAVPNMAAFQQHRVRDSNLRDLRDLREVNDPNVMRSGKAAVRPVSLPPPVALLQQTAAPGGMDDIVAMNRDVPLLTDSARKASARRASELRDEVRALSQNVHSPLRAARPQPQYCAADPRFSMELF